MEANESKPNGRSRQQGKDEAQRTLRHLVVSGGSFNHSCPPARRPLFLR
jgi:hypothetical protein